MKRKHLTSLRKFSFAFLAPILSLSLASCAPDEIEEANIPCNQEDHVHAVDLGLSVKWACCNIGANSPEEYGGYYAWGESEEKDYYDSSTYTWLNIETNEMTKYNEIDGKTTLDLEDDAAHILWGEDWRMPTQSEFQELMDRCTWEWTSLNGVYGYKVSGNGNSIFLPAAGSRYEDITTNQGSRSCYMSSTLYVDDTVFECCLAFNKKDYYWINEYRRNGHTVRPVTK